MIGFPAPAIIRPQPLKWLQERRIEKIPLKVYGRQFYRDCPEGLVSFRRLNLKVGHAGFSLPIVRGQEHAPALAPKKIALLSEYLIEQWEIAGANPGAPIGLPGPTGGWLEYWNPGLYEILAAPTVVFILQGTVSYARPALWNNANNQVEAVGAAGKGGTGGSGGVGGGAGAGGAYSLALNLTIAASVTVQVGNGGTVASGPGGTDTFFDGSSRTVCQCGARGGAGVASGQSGGAQTAADSVGSTQTVGGKGGSGGSGTAAQHQSGGGGGGAGGPAGAGGAGGNGVNAAGTVAANGGTGGNGGGPNGGVGGGGGSGANAVAGGAGTTWDASHGTGGGGGGGGETAGGVARISAQGGLYGGGGGGKCADDLSATTDAQVQGRDGLLVVQYTPATGHYRMFLGF